MITTLTSIVNTLVATGVVDFPANYKITSKDHVYVYYVDGEEAEVLLVQVTSFTAGTPNEYKINAITDSGFNVELRDAYDTADGRKISIRRVLPLTQEVDYPPGNDFPAATHERALDKLTAIVQQFNETISRQIGVPFSEDAGETTLPAYISNYYLGLDGDNNLIWKVGTVAVGNDEIKSSHIDWGTGVDQVFAEDMPIEDVGSIITAINVEGALQENRAALNTHKAADGKEHSDVVLNNTYRVDNTLEVVSSDKVMESPKKYFLSDNVVLQLPANPSIGDEIDIFSDSISEIQQTDSAHLIEYKQEQFTTVGIAGILKLLYRTVTNLIYKGAGTIFQVPDKLSAVTGGDPAGAGYGSAFSPDGVYLAVAHDVTPFLTIYKRTGDTFAKLGAVTGGDPAGIGIGVGFSSDGVYLAVAHSVTPFLTIYKRTGDTFAKLGAVTGGDPANTGRGAVFSADDTYLSITHSDTPFLTIYKRTGDTFAKLDDPASLPAGVGYGSAFSLDGVYLAVAHNVSPNVTIYKRSGDVFTKLGNPSNLPGGNGRGVSMSGDGIYLTVAHDVSPYVTNYKRSGDVFTKLTTVGGGNPTGNPNGCASILSGSRIIITHETTPYITVYSKLIDTYSKVTAPTAPAGNGNGVSVTKDGVYFAIAHDTTPFVTVYKLSLSVDKIWILKEVPLNIDVPTIFL